MNISMSGMVKPSDIRSAFSYCVQQVRTYDYHHYLCILELPPRLRRPAFAIRAFNVETASAMDVASDPKIGLVRLLWWQDSVRKIFSGLQIQHPVAQALATVVSDHRINKSWMMRSVDARIADARREVGHVPETLSDLERYAEDTVSTVLYSILQAGGVLSTAADHAASHIGKASGLLVLLRSLPHHAGQNRGFAYVPSDIAARHGLLVSASGATGSFDVRVEPGEGLCKAVLEIASVAGGHLRKARELSLSVPGEARPVLLAAIPAQVMLDSLRRVGYDVFNDAMMRGVLGISPLSFQLKLKWHSWRRIY